MVVCPDEMDASYMDELEEFVKDDGRIVTYKWLSLTLRVPSNVAKQMLHHYASSHQQEGQGTKPPISVTYLVSGLLKDDEGKVKKGEASTSTLKKVVWLVDERDLSAARESLCAITSVHIYSVQKTAPQDLATLYAAHYDKAKEHISDSHKYSGVSCTFARVNPARGRIQQVIAEAEPPTEKPSQNTRVAANPSTATTTATTTATATATTTAATATKPTNQIASMFAQQAKKVDAPKKTIVKEEKPPIKKSPGGISAFFTKGAVAPRKAENSEKKKEIKEEIKEEVKEEKEEIKEMKKKEKDLFVIGKTAEEKVKKSKASTSTQKKRKGQRKEADEPKVKRSRILQISDSESEEEEKEEEEDLLLLPPPPPSPPLTQTIQSDEEEEEEEKKKKEDEEDRKGKKKIMVDETFMDEDGYLVTNKVYKYVDLTEEEIKEEEKERKREEENRKKREEEAKKREEEKRKREEEAGSSPSSPQKKKRGKKDDGKKQSSIMSFFGKK